MEEQIYLKFLSVIAPIALGIMSYFIKDAMNNHKKNTEKIIDIEKNYVKKDELDEKLRETKKEINENINMQVTNIKDDISDLKKMFHESNNKTLQAVEKLATEVNDIKLNYISKEDFLKQNATLSNKLDKLTDIVIEERTKNICRN